MQQNIEEVKSQASSREAGLQVIIQQLRSHLEKAHVSLALLVLIMCSLSSCVCVRVPVCAHRNTYKNACVCVHSCAFTCERAHLCIPASVHVREEQAALKEEHQRRLTTKESEQNHIVIAHPQHQTAQRSGDSHRHLDDLFRNDCFPRPPNHPPLKTSPTSLVLYIWTFVSDPL
jgi:hypothetical protein